MGLTSDDVGFLLSLGLFVDLTGRYESVLVTSMIFLLISFVSFGLTILLLEQMKINEPEQPTSD